MLKCIGLDWIALPATLTHSQPLSPTPTHFVTKATHSHPFFNKNNPLPPIVKKNDPLPPIFPKQQLPTPTHFLTKTTHSHQYFKKSDPLSLIFQENNPLPLIIWQKQHPPTLILTITTHSHPFFDKKSPSQIFLMKNDPFLLSFNKNKPIPPIFQQIRPTSAYFSTKTTYSHNSHPFFHWPSTKVTSIHQFSNYNRLSLSATINALNELSLENIIFEYSTSEKKGKAYFSKNQSHPSILLYMKYGRQYIT